MSTYGAIRVLDLFCGAGGAAVGYHRALGIDWMTWDELREAIPPAYTEHLGAQFVPVLTTVSVRS